MDIYQSRVSCDHSLSDIVREIISLSALRTKTRSPPVIGVKQWASRPDHFLSLLVCLSVCLTLSAEGYWRNVSRLWTFVFVVLIRETIVLLALGREKISLACFVSQFPLKKLYTQFDTTKKLVLKSKSQICYFWISCEYIGLLYKMHTYDTSLSLYLR